MGPALVMAETRACLRTLAQSHDNVGEMLTRANRLLVRDTDDLHFVTLALARLEPKTRRMTYASAGQRGYLFNRGGNVRVLDATSAPLGIEKEMCVPVAPPVNLEAGQLLVFFTDGVVEAESHGHVRFGAHRAVQLIQQRAGKAGGPDRRGDLPGGLRLSRPALPVGRYHGGGGQGLVIG